MALQSDAYGFLVGAPVEWGRALKVFDEIRDEVRALRGDIANGASTQALMRAADAVSRQAKTVSRSPSSQSVPPTAPTNAAVSNPARPNKQAAVSPTRAPAMRLPNGRFASAVPISSSTVAPSRSAPTRGPGGRFISATSLRPVASVTGTPRRPFQIPVVGVEDGPRPTPPSAETAAPAKRKPDPTTASPSHKVEVIDRSSLGNRKDVDAFSEESRTKVGKALAEGKSVYYVIEGKRYQITSADGGRLKDTKGQQWGMANLLMPSPGDHSRLEIHDGTATPTIRQPFQVPVSTDAGLAQPALPKTVRTAAEIKATIAAQNAAMSQTRPVPLDTGEKATPATPSRARGPTPEQKAGDRDADREARAQERAEAKNAKELKSGGRKTDRTPATVGKRNEKDAASPGLAVHAYDAVSGAPEIDPTIAAVHEVQAAIAPVGRGLSHLFGRPTGAHAWYKRIWNELRGQRKDQSTFHKAEQKTLQEIDDKTGSSGRGLFGRAGSLLSKIPGVGLLGGLIGGGVRGASSLAGLALRGGKGLLKGGAGLLRRLPLIGMALEAGSGIAGAFGANDDPNKSPEENRAERFRSGGSGIGAALGGGIGMLLGGPLGSVLGQAVGDKVGELVGKWLATVDWGKIGTSISDTWNGAVKEFSDIWDSVSKWFKDKFGIVTNVANKANDYVKDKTGVDVKATTVKVANAVSSAAKDTASVAKEAAGAATAYVSDRVTKLATPLVNAGKAAKDWVLGKTSQFFESGTRGAAAISSGKGDHGGASYGTYQLASAGGAKSTLSKFLASSGYASQFAGMTPGSPEFNAKWKQIASIDPAFGAAQHDFIKSTHYDPQMTLLGKSGIDLSNRGSAVQDAVWSTSVQFGGQTSLIKSALAGKDPSKMSDAEIVTAIQNYKIAHNSDLFKSSSTATQASTLNRASVERSRLLALAQPLPSPSATPGINVPAVADAAAPVPASFGKPAAVEVRVSKDAGDVGPTVSDPKIARLVSGGLS